MNTFNSLEFYSHDKDFTEKLLLQRNWLSFR